MRKSEVKRNTTETQISCTLQLDGTGENQINTGCGFLNHMLELFARHGRFDLVLTCKGDTQVDDHHTVEDVGIALGTAFAKALGNGAGIVRYGSMLLPMDEALVEVVLDISGRAGLYDTLAFVTEKIGSFDTQLVQEFLIAFTRTMGLTLHVRQLAGTNSHHIAEACFKGLARALAAAVAVDEKLGGAIPSTKGVLL
ncbi:MAG: imidazoleglycerol-phosphate dehydratase HisB [Oscillospiraceae bacterium]